MDGVLIGSPLCDCDERLQIDALLITPNAVCIIDFKNFGGAIHLPQKNKFEEGLWKTADEKLVKGGNSCNPFQQLRKQKGWLHDLSDKDAFKPAHTMLAVCFQEEVKLIGEIPPDKAMNFHIFDKSNFVEKILDIIDIHDGEVRLSKDAFEIFKRIFRADTYKIDDKPLEDKLKELAEKSEALDYSTLYSDQRKALEEIKSFLNNPEQRVFILQGTTNSGKSYLIPFIQELAFYCGIQETELFAQSSRVANNLLKASGIEKINSIYSFIFGGKKSVTNNEAANDNELGEDAPEEGEKLIEEVPLKTSGNSEDALFIVDESQLINNNLYESEDIRFGSGRLLNDFIAFADLQHTKRKIVFIGDPYQLGAKDTALDATYFESAYDIKPLAMQLQDKPNFSRITKGALACTDGIRKNTFNALKLESGTEIVALDKNTRLQEVADLLRKGIDGCVLFYRNEDAYKFNEWVKKTVIRTGERIAVNDLVLFCNNITIEDDKDPFAEPKKIYNGQFATVLNAGRELPVRSVSIKKGLPPVDLRFRELSVELKESGSHVKIFELQNHRLSAKGELATHEQIALRILLNDLLRKRMRAEPFEESTEYRDAINSENYKNFQDEIMRLNAQLQDGGKVKGKRDELEKQQKKILKNAKKLYRNRIEFALRSDPSSEYFQIKNAAHLKFGWAITIHKSRSYKWREAILNFEKTGGKMNEEFFRLVYTGLSRAIEKIFLINYAPITPLNQAVITDKSTGAVPKGYWYVSDKKAEDAIRDEIREHVSSSLENQGVTIEDIEHQNWREMFYLKKNDEIAQISVYFNQKGQINNPSFIKGNEKLGEFIIQALKRERRPFDFSIFAKNEWRKLFYERLAAMLEASQTYFVDVQQSNYKDTVRLARAEQGALIEFVYNAKSAITHISAIHYSEPKIWEDVQHALQMIQLEGI